MADPNEQEPVDQTPEEQQVRERQLLEVLEDEKRVEALRGLLQQEPVRDLLWRVLSRCHMYESIFKTNFGEMCRLEGERNLGLWLLSEIAEADPGAEMLMRQKAIAVAHARAEQERLEKKRRGRRSS